MDDDFTNTISSLIETLTKPIKENSYLKQKLKKIQKENQRQSQVLSYYQSALKNYIESYHIQQENYNQQITSLRILSENYENQIKSLFEQKNETVCFQDQIQLISNEIVILEDKLGLLHKNNQIKKNFENDSKISILKHQAFKLQEKLKSCRFVKNT